MRYNLMFSRRLQHCLGRKKTLISIYQGAVFVLNCAVEINGSGSLQLLLIFSSHLQCKKIHLPKLKKTTHSDFFSNVTSSLRQRDNWCLVSDGHLAIKTQTAIMRPKAYSEIFFFSVFVQQSSFASMLWHQTFIPRFSNHSTKLLFWVGFGCLQILGGF